MLVIIASQRIKFEASAKVMRSLFNLYQGNPLHISRNKGNQKSISFKAWREMGGQTEVFYFNVKIMLHHRLDLINDECIRESDEGVSAQGQFIYCP